MMSESQSSDPRETAVSGSSASEIADTSVGVSAGMITPVARLELREERAQLDIDRSVQQHLTFRREVRTRTETHTAELRSEVLVISLAEGDAAVRIGDHDLKPGETFELLLYNERLEVSKRPYLSEIVEIGKQTVAEQRSVAVDLQYEVLTVEEGPGLVKTLIPPGDTGQL